MTVATNNAVVNPGFPVIEDGSLIIYCEIKPNKIEMKAQKSNIDMDIIITLAECLAIGLDFFLSIISSPHKNSKGSRIQKLH